MSSNHNRPTPPKSPKAELLGELESIKGLLEDELELDINIPILSDVVAADGSQQQPGDLLDLNSIFEDDDAEPSPLAAPLSASSTLQLSLPPTPVSPARSTELYGEPSAPSLAESYPEQQATTTDTSFEGLEDYSLDDLNLDDLNLEGLDLEDLDASIKIPSFKLSTALSNQLLTEQDKTDATDLFEALTDASSEEQEDMFFHADSIAPAPDIGTTGKTIELDLLIQEIVDDFIPAIEDALRKKLSQCSADVIQQLAEKHLQR